MLYLRVRHGNPHLPRLAPWPFDDSRRVLPVLFGYSREVLPAPSDWPASAVVTGYWFLPTPGGWSPSAELSRFLDSGPPPVYFGVGSMRTRHMHRLVDVAVSAIRAAGLRGILGVPDAAFGDLPRDQFRLVQDVPHDWLFPRMRMLIHHGGAGTTGAALRAGVPSAAVPFTADQAFWGRRIQRLGVGPAPSPALRLTSAGLTRVLDEVTRDAQMQGRAAVLGSRIRQEDGVASAIEVILERLG
jgi:sterol 3beta-glucosyltransferase